MAEGAPAEGPYLGLAGESAGLLCRRQLECNIPAFSPCGPSLPAWCKALSLWLHVAIPPSCQQLHPVRGTAAGLA